MNKTTKITVIILLIVTLPLLFIYVTFSNSYNCDQLVIDTYELHSKIDIPEVDYVNCYYDASLNTRISVYDLEGTIDLNAFEMVNSSRENFLHGSKLLMDEEQPKASTIYLASGERWGTQWTYAVDQNSQRLWAELKYE